MLNSLVSLKNMNTINSRLAASIQSASGTVFLRLTPLISFLKRLYEWHKPEQYAYSHGLANEKPTIPCTPTGIIKGRACLLLN